MIVIIAAGYWFYFDKAKVVIIGLLEREYDINKVLAKLCNVSKAGFVANGDHGFCRVNGNVSNQFVLFYKVVEQFQCMSRFAIQKILQGFVFTGMRLIGFYELLVTYRACPHFIGI